MDLARLDENRIRAGLKDRVTVSVLEEIDSTSTEGRRRLMAGLREPALILSEAQTAGRGRMGHTFYSPKQDGIYMSLVYPAGDFNAELFRVTAKAAVAVFRGVKQSTGIDLSIKWVNDLCIGNEKVAGILTECVAIPEKWFIIGIGINVTTTKFPSDLIGKARSLNPLREGMDETLAGAMPDRNEIVIAVIGELLSELLKPEDRSYLETYRAQSNVIGREIVYGTEKTGTATGIDDEGKLVVRTPEGREELLDSGEIRVRIIES